MANDVVKLTWAADGEADEATLNLLDFVQGLTLAEGGWIPQVATGDQATVTETMTFRAQALSHDQLAGYVQVLDDWIIKIGWSHDFTQRQFVWLNARWKSETKVRRAPVYSLSYSLGSEASPFGVYLRDDSFVPTLTIVMVRGAYWEDTALVSINNLGIGTAGDADYMQFGGGNYIAIGDVPARISRLGFNYAPAQLRYTWLGIRASRNGVLANFAPVWNLKDAVWLKNIAHGEASDDTVTTVDATANSGTRLTTSFAGGATLLNRVRIKASDVTANTADQRGIFVCLLRAKMSDASIARVRISSGFATANYSNPYFINPRTTVQGTSWFLYDMGLLRLPALAREYSSDAVVMSQASAIIDAERVSGAGNLHMDCLILIPYNDSYINLDIGNDSFDASVFTHPDFTYSAFDSVTLQQSDIQPSAWNFPANNEAPLVVIASQAAAAHALTPSAQVTMIIANRWRTLRGNE